MKRHKYHAQKTEYNGVMYDSKLEATVAKKLDLLRKAVKPSERIVEIERQVPFILECPPVMYKADFYVTYADGHKEIVEAKGVELPEWRKKYRLMKKQFPQTPIKVVKK